MKLSRREFSLALAAAGTAARAAQPSISGAFLHGVASGDPLANRVILWTRVTPPNLYPPFVEWHVSDSPDFSRIVRLGVTAALPQRDYTVKVDATGLLPGTTYYYRFRSLGQDSPIGRTKTLPIGAVDRLRFAIASCANYPRGFFNAYRKIAQRPDLDAVIHVGDYIYEYENGKSGDGTAIGRIPEPNKELLTLEDYRTRYAQYRSDPDLQEVHRQNPFIVVWDDHDSANDAWMGGAENHNPGQGEGEWVDRRANSIRAWYEWLPVREGPFVPRGLIYRAFQFGGLADMIMLDTRIIGRGQQVNPSGKTLDQILAEVYDRNRSLLGDLQERWFFDRLVESKQRGARWRLVGQQVMLGQLMVTGGRPLNLDQWDGYGSSRHRFLGHLLANQISNVVVVTGDLHSSWANEIAVNPFHAAGYQPLAVEFVGPGITSPAIDSEGLAQLLEGIVGGTHPHVKHVDIYRRGYFLVDINWNRVQAEWYHPDTVTAPSDVEEFGFAIRTASGTNRLFRALPTTPKPDAPPLAP